MNIGFIGLGNMGYPIMLRLCNLEHNLFVYDENLVKFKRLKKTESLICCDNASSVAKKSDVVFTCLPSIENVEYVLLGQKNYKGICNVLKSGSLCVDLSSSDPLKTKILVMQRRSLIFRLVIFWNTLDH